MTRPDRNGIFLAGIAHTLARLEITETEWDDLFRSPGLEQGVLRNMDIMRELLSQPEHNAVRLISEAREVFGDQAANQLMAVFNVKFGEDGR